MAIALKALDKQKSLKLINESVKNIHKIEEISLKSKIYSFA